jgi:general secretion pathway protein M
MNFFEKTRLSPRDQRSATIGVVVIGLLIVLGVPLGLGAMASGKKTEVDDLRAALSSVQNARSKVRDRKAREDSIAFRYSKRAPALAGFLEQSARAQKLEVSDSQDRAEVPHGKRYVERNTVIHFKKAGMRPLAKFIEGLEQSGNALSVTRLNVRKRSGEPDSYDVEVGVSAFDRNVEAPKAAPSPDKDKKEPTK